MVCLNAYSNSEKNIHTSSIGRDMDKNLNVTRVTNTISKNQDAHTNVQLIMSYSNVFNNFL